MLVSGSAVGAAQDLTWSCPSVLLPSVSPAVRTSAFLWWERSAPSASPSDSASARRIMWVQSAARTAGGKVGVFLLSPAAPGFQLWFYFHLYMWFVHWSLAPEAALEGFAPGRASCGGDAAAWVTGVLATPGTQGGWQLGQQEIECSRRGWQPVLANTRQYSCLENPLP